MAIYKIIGQHEMNTLGSEYIRKLKSLNGQNCVKESTTQSRF